MCVVHGSMGVPTWSVVLVPGAIPILLSVFPVSLSVPRELRASPLSIFGDHA